MQSSISAIDVIIIVIYIVGTTAFGAWFVKRNHDMKSFTSAGSVDSKWVFFHDKVLTKV